MTIVKDSTARRQALRRLEALARRQDGLSVAEFVLVLAILTVVIAVFAPATLRKRIYAHEALAAGGLSAIARACADYRSTSNPPAYPRKLSDLVSGDALLLDQELAAGAKSGYLFTLSAETGTDTPARFTAEAHPIVYRREGVRSFFIDQSGQLLAEDIGGFPGHAAMPAFESLRQEETE